MKYRVLFLLLLFGLVALPACAAEITFTAEKSEYYVPLGEPADIPILVTSTYPGSIDGTIRFTTTEQLQNSGMVMTSSKNRVYSHTVPAGSSQITLSAGSSDVEKSVQVQVVYDYSDTSVIEVTLPAITVHFVRQVPQPSGSQSPVTSTSAPGSGNVPTTSSVQIVQQTASAQQQAGRDGSLQQALSNSQQAQDSSALREQLQRESQQAAENKAELEQRLETDPLLASVNASLASEGFLRQSLETSPRSGNSGSFSMGYRNAAGGSVTLAGAMENGTVPSVREQSESPVNVPAPLAANATFQAMAEQLAGQGYTRNSTQMDLSPSATMVNLTFRNPGGKPAFINATTNGTDVTQISLATEAGAPFDYLPLAAGIAVAAIVLAAAWILYRRFRRPGAPAFSIPGMNVPEEPFDHRKAANDLLARAGEAYAEQQQAVACGLAGQALRLFLSYENGAHREMTNAELLAFLQARGGDIQRIREMLERCTDVEFAKGSVDSEGFAAIVSFIRGTIDGAK